MEISVLQEELEKGVSAVSKFINPRPQLPILSHILISIEKGRMRLCGTNLESGINYWLGVKVEEEGSTTVLCQTLLNIVGNLQSGKIDIKEKDKMIELSSGGSVITIPTTPVSEFPNISYELPKKHITLTREDFSTITQQVVWASGGEETKPIFTGILFFPKNEGLFVVATDGIRLSQKRVTGKINFPSSVVIPAKIITEIPKLFTSKTVEIGFQEKENGIIFSGDDVVVTTKLLEGEFPDFEKIIPSAWSTKVAVGKDDLQRALRLSAIFARDYVVKFEFSEGECRLVSENPQTGTQNSTVPAKIEGDGITIAFNWRFVNDFLNAVGENEVEFRFVGPASPGMFLNPKDDSYFHLIMPVRSQE